MEKKFVANKALLVNKDGKILLLRDAGLGDHAHAKGMWDVPGGRMEANETPKQGLVREVKEELGLEIDATLARPFHVDLWGVGGDKINNPIIGIFYLVPLPLEDFKLSDEHTEMMWFDPKDPIPEEMQGSDIPAIIAAYCQAVGIV